MKMNKILTVDDSETDQFYVKAIINSYDPDIQIIQAYDGREALNILRDHQDQKPDLILLDINMPGMNGHEFLKEYHQLVDQKSPVIVILTSSSEEKDIEQTKMYSNVVEYLTKPIRHETLNAIQQKYTLGI
ncbi:MAG: response regulator [Alcanivorax sp.]